ncbi:hypothetical protein JCM10207_003920 [Rhodosporidiobolus poonsookiae]
MSSMTKGDCCVFGEATDKRCSACSTAGVDLFFCSKEHQKLVWKTHGKICGLNAEPFLPPDFTIDEAAEAIRHGRENSLALRCDSLVHAFLWITGLPQNLFEECAPVLRYPLANAGAVHLSPFYPVAHLESQLLSIKPSLLNNKELNHILHLALVLFTLVDHKKKSPQPEGYETAFAFQAYKKLQLAISHATSHTCLQAAYDLCLAVQSLTKPLLRFDTYYQFDGESFKLVNLWVKPVNEETLWTPTPSSKQPAMRFGSLDDASEASRGEMGGSA